MYIYSELKCKINC